MAITRGTMTDEQRKSVAIEYLKAFDNKGLTSSGGSMLDLFASDAQVFFPKWGLATGRAQITRLFTDFGGLSVAAFQFHLKIIDVNGWLSKKPVISDNRVDVGNVL